MMIIYLIGNNYERPFRSTLYLGLVIDSVDSLSAIISRSYEFPATLVIVVPSDGRNASSSPFIVSSFSTSSPSLIQKL